MSPGTTAAAVTAKPPHRVGFFGSGLKFVKRASRLRAAATRSAVVVARVSVPLACAAADEKTNFEFLMCRIRTTTDQTK